MLKKIKNWLPSKRKIMQLYFAVLVNANAKGFITGTLFQGKTKNVCAPGINCYSCPGAIAACPLGSLQGALKSDNHSTWFYVGGILLLYSIMFGRMICGWLCPFGLIQELFYKIKTPKLKKSPVTRLLSYLKYALLVFLVLIVPIMYALHKQAVPGFCKYVCPAGIVEGAIPLLASPTAASHYESLASLFTWKFMLSISIIVGSIFIFRLFCRFICPLGALYGLFNKISVFGIRVDNAKCTHCGLCHAKCKVDIRTPGDQECISCGECVGVCPTKAISWKGPKILLAPNEGTDENPDLYRKKKIVIRTISAFILLAVLVGTVIYAWKVSTDVMQSDSVDAIVNQENENTDIPLGNQPGNLCYSYDLEIVNGSGGTQETIDPTKTGKITIVNFWGTWCGPCVEELPDFERIATEYADSVTVIAIHSVALADTAPGYIADKYPNSKLIFSWEKDNAVNGAFYKALGGNGGYPFTVILDENGVILKVVNASIHYDELKTIVDNQLSK